MPDIDTAIAVEADASTPPTGRVLTTRPVTKIGFLRGFVTQASLKGPLAVETWYGHHSPWLRIIAFWLLITLPLATTFLLASFYMAPILQWNLPQQMITNARQSQTDCVNAICGALVSLPPFTCIINADGNGAMVDNDEFLLLPDEVYVPPVCYDAADMTMALFGQSTNFTESREESHPFLMISKINAKKLGPLDQGEEQHSLSPPTLYRDCTLLLSDISGAESLSIVPWLSASEFPTPGERVPIDFRKTPFCANLYPDEQKKGYDGIIDTLVDSVSWAYDGILDNRYSIFFALGGFIWTCAFFGYILGYGLPLLLTTFAARALLKWPKDLVDGDKVSFWSVWKMLLLITFITEQRDGNALSIIPVGLLAYSAHRYGDRSATGGWADLGIAWIGAPYAYPLLDAIGSKVARFDALNLIPFASSVLIPGNGWWKLVRLYAYYKAYRSLMVATKASANVVATVSEELPPLKGL